MTQRDIFVRKVNTQNEMRQALAWFDAAREKTGFDAEVLAYPNTVVIAAYVKQTKEPLLYVPVHRPLMLDGLGPNPLASVPDIAAALAEITKALAFSGFLDNIGELYFPSSDAETISFATRHGFEIMDYEAVEEMEEEEVPASENGGGAAVKNRKVVRKLMPFLKMKLLT